MFECQCCTPPVRYSHVKSLYRHERKKNPAFVEPREKQKLAYEANPLYCLTCNMDIQYKDLHSKTKFCSRSCAATHNNTKRKANKSCEGCNQPMTGRGSYCSLLCHQETIYRKITKPKIERGEISERRVLKKYLVKEWGWVCRCCEETQWLNQPIPLEVDHIDGDPSNDLPENLRLICPNCHALQPTSKGKNRGRGRKARGLRLN